MSIADHAITDPLLAFEVSAATQDLTEITCRDPRCRWSTLLPREQTLRRLVTEARAHADTRHKIMRRYPMTWGHWRNPVIYMSRATAVEVWRHLYGADPDMSADLRYGLTGVPVRFDDRMQFGESRLEEDPDPGDPDAP